MAREDGSGGMGNVLKVASVVLIIVAVGIFGYTLGAKGITTTTTTVPTTFASTTQSTTVYTTTSSTSSVSTSVPTSLSTTTINSGQSSVTDITGNEQITINGNSITDVSITAGGNTILGYTIAITNGYSSFASSVTALNLSLLSSNGITVLFPGNSGNPPFTANVYIFTNHNTNPGRYNITLIGEGNDYITTKPATVFVDVTQSST